MAKQTKKLSKKASSLKTRKHVDHHVRHRIIIGAGLVFIALLVGLVLALVIVPKVYNDTRLSRINDIYKSIQLPDNLYFYEETIFGDKRSYPNAPEVTFASRKSFVIPKTVTETADSLDAAILNAGYSKIETLHPGSTSKEHHYKTDRGEFIRLTVSSKTRDDMASNELLMNGSFSEAFYKLDPNAGPSRVILKVNLDSDSE